MYAGPGAIDEEGLRREVEEAKVLLAGLVELDLTVAVSVASLREVEVLRTLLVELVVVRPVDLVNCSRDGVVRMRCLGREAERLSREGAWRREVVLGMAEDDVVEDEVVDLGFGRREEGRGMPLWRVPCGCNPSMFSQVCRHLTLVRDFVVHMTGCCGDSSWARRTKMHSSRQ